MEPTGVAPGSTKIQIEVTLDLLDKLRDAYINNRLNDLNIIEIDFHDQSSSLDHARPPVSILELQNKSKRKREQKK